MTHDHTRCEEASWVDDLSPPSVPSPSLSRAGARRPRCGGRTVAGCGRRRGPRTSGRAARPRAPRATWRPLAAAAPLQGAGSEGGRGWPARCQGGSKSRGRDMGCRCVLEAGRWGSGGRWVQRDGGCRSRVRRRGPGSMVIATPGQRSTVNAPYGTCACVASSRESRSKDAAKADSSGQGLCSLRVRKVRGQRAIEGRRGWPGAYGGSRRQSRSGRGIRGKGGSCSAPNAGLQRTHGLGHRGSENSS
jgi:hypothetical protein